MSSPWFFDDEFDVQVQLVNLLDKVTFKEAAAITYAVDKWNELDKVKEELEFTRKYVHDNGLEFDLLSKYSHYCKSKGDC